MDQDTSPRYVASDEIDLMGLIVSLWEEKWTIIGVTALVAALSVVFVLLPVHSYKGSMEIKPVSLNQEAAYLVLNDAREALIESLDADVQKHEAIDKSYLVESLAAELNRRDVFYPHLEASGLIDREADESDSEFLERVSQLAYEDITFEAPTDADARVVKPYWRLNIATKDPIAMKSVLTQAFADAEARVKQALVVKVENEIALKQDQNAFALDKLRFEYQDALASYDDEVKNRLAYLQEQAGIARSLGIAKNTIEAQTFGAGNSVVAALPEEMPLYLRGYEAIEREIELIKARDEKTPYIDELVKINSQIRQIESDVSVRRVQQALAQSPLKTDGFKAASYEIRGMKLESKTRSVLPVILGIFLGGMIGMVVALVRAGFRKRAAWG